MCCNSRACQRKQDRKWFVSLIGDDGMVLMQNPSNLLVHSRNSSIDFIEPNASCKPIATTTSVQRLTVCDPYHPSCAGLDFDLVGPHVEQDCDFALVAWAHIFRRLDLGGLVWGCGCDSA